MLASKGDSLGNNALHWSVLTRQLDLIQLFVQAGTPIDNQRADGQTPVLLALNGATDYWYRETRSRTHPSLRNSSVVVGSLLALGASYTISVAAAVGDWFLVQKHLSQDPSLAKQLDSARVSPLSYAAREGHHILNLLLDHGADPNTPEDLAPDGRALFEACCGNRLEIARVLLEHGANPNAGLDSSGRCLTICEVCHGVAAKPLQNLLRRHGAYTPPYAMSAREKRDAIQRKDKVIQHEEFLTHVIGQGTAELLGRYLDSDPTATKRIPSAVYPKSPSLVKTLIARGFDPNHRDWLGRTPLHFCAANADETIATVFLNAGAGVNVRDFQFKGTPLAAAVRSWSASEEPAQTQKRLRMIKLLFERGAATNLPDDESWATPLAWAQKRGAAEIEKILVEHGAR